MNLLVKMKRAQLALDRLPVGFTLKFQPKFLRQPLHLSSHVSLNLQASSDSDAVRQKDPVSPHRF
jgi:hypothetical protein